VTLDLTYIKPSHNWATGWTPAAASSTLEEWTCTFSRRQQCSCFRITVFYGVRA